MANHTYSKGLLYKKTLNSSGEVTGSVPLLLKTLGSLVIMSDGTDAETAISTAISNMVTPDETTIVTGQDGITISVKKSTSAEIDEILGDVPTSHTWEGYYTKSETEALIDAVDDKITQSGIETALGYTPIPTTAKGSNNGVAELDSAGKVPASQLPSYVDDVIESATYAALPATGEAGKIYVTLNDDKTYRWSGSAYVEISASLALGETSSTAYRGDRGKTAYDHSQAAHARTDATNAAIVSGKLNINGTATNIGDFKAVSTAASQGLTDTEKTNARTNIDAASNSDLVEVVNNGAKNLFNPTSVDHSIATINGDKSITVNYTTVTSDTYIHIAFDNHDYSWILMPDEWKGNIFSNLPNNLTGGILLLIEYSNNGTGWASEQDLKIGTSSVTLASNYAYCRVAIKIPANTASTTFTVYPMITTKAQFGISSAYEPYALGNQVITPAMIQKVDEGAKNLVEVTSSNIGGTNTNVSVTVNSDKSIKITGNGSAIGGLTIVYIPVYIPAGTYVLSGCPSGADYNNGYTCDLRDTSNSSRSSTDSGNGTEFTLSSGGNYRWCIRLAATYVIPSGGVTFKPMICTLADWNVSHKFVPYRPNMDLVDLRLTNLENWVESRFVPFATLGDQIRSFAIRRLKGTTNARIPIRIVYCSQASGHSVASLDLALLSNQGANNTPILSVAAIYTSVNTSDVAVYYKLDTTHQICYVSMKMHTANLWASGYLQYVNSLNDEIIFDFDTNTDISSDPAAVKLDLYVPTMTLLS